VAILRQEAGQRSVAVFDLRQVRAGRMIDPEIHPGDRVLVGYDGMQQAWLDILAAAPLLAVFTNY
jgi:polysaccharide export outer membrane protein